VQASKLPTAVLSTTKRSKERAKKKAAAKAAGTAGKLTMATSSMDVDDSKTEAGKVAEEGVSKEEEAKAAVAEEERKEAEDKADAAMCPFAMENPARCALSAC
jgi:hypothetical protein